MDNLGIDVASYQGYPDWSRVAASGVQFAITKLSESVDYINPTFDHNWRGIRDNGLIRGVYHFARPNRNPDPATEAYWFTAHLPRLETGDIIALDLEDLEVPNGQNIDEWILQWLDTVRDAVGSIPIVYTGPWYIMRQRIRSPRLGEFGLWVASYTSQIPTIGLGPWDFPAIWQYTDNGRIDGINANVDLNTFNGPIERLPLYGKPEGATAVQPLTCSQCGAPVNELGEYAP